MTTSAFSILLRLSQRADATACSAQWSCSIANQLLSELFCSPSSISSSASSYSASSGGIRLLRASGCSRAHFEPSGFEREPLVKSNLPHQDKGLANPCFLYWINLHCSSICSTYPSGAQASPPPQVARLSPPCLFFASLRLRHTIATDLFCLMSFQW